MLCLYRKKCYGAHFCTLTKKHCGIKLVLKCLWEDLWRQRKKKDISQNYYRF